MRRATCSTQRSSLNWPARSPAWRLTSTARGPQDSHPAKPVTALNLGVALDLGGRVQPTVLVDWSPPMKSVPRAASSCLESTPSRLRCTVTPHTLEERGRLCQRIEGDGLTHRPSVSRRTSRARRLRTVKPLSALRRDRPRGLASRRRRSPTQNTAPFEGRFVALRQSPKIGPHDLVRSSGLAVPRTGCSCTTAAVDSVT
jgi:hypothetical protein